MSGRFNNVGETMREILEEMGDDPEVRKRWPLLAVLFPSVGEWVSKIEESIDMDMDGDHTIPNQDRAFELAAAGALIDRVLKLIPDILYPLGKKATVEKWQAMTGSEVSPGFVGERYPRDLWGHDV